MTIRIALAGNPNCGKTTIFNDLTGSAQYVGNWAGVTVEKKEGNLKPSFIKGKTKQQGEKLQTAKVQIIDLPGIYALSPYSMEEVVTRDYLLTAKPEVILNVIDATNLERNLYLTTQLLEVGIPVVVVLNMMDLVPKSGRTIDVPKLAAALGCPVFEAAAIKGDGLQVVVDQCLRVAALGNVPTKTVKFDGKLERILAEIEQQLVPRPTEITAENRRWYLIKLFERDEKILSKLQLTEAEKAAIESLIVPCEQEFDDDSESIITVGRYTYIEEITKSAVKQCAEVVDISAKIDKVLTNRILALPIFAVVMCLIYYISIQTVGATTIGWVESFFAWVSRGIEAGLVAVSAAPWLISLINDGIIGGVGAVLGFVPQMMVLFFFLSILEDCGYMARVAFIMDKLFRKFGLSGKAFIPMLISSGCAVPGIMATRTMENQKDRRLTMMVTTFIPCGAKLPIIALIAGALFSDAVWVAPSMYFLSIAVIIFSGLFLKRTKLFSGDTAPFILELPSYHLPKAKNLLLHVWERSKAFIIKAGTVIFVACGVIWFLASFNLHLEMVDTAHSILAEIGSLVAPIFAPLGFGNWQASVATITGLLAKENVVGTLGVLYGLGDVSGGTRELWALVAQDFTVYSGYAFMAFNMLCAPCVAAIGAMHREMGGWKWTLTALAFQTIVAYVVALLINQIGSLL